MSAATPALEDVLAAIKSEMDAIGTIGTVITSESPYEDDVEFILKNGYKAGGVMDLWLVELINVAELEGAAPLEIYEQYQVLIRYWSLRTGDPDWSRRARLNAELVRDILSGNQAVFAIDGQQQLRTPETVQVDSHGPAPIRGTEGDQMVFVTSLSLTVEARRWGGAADSVGGPQAMGYKVLGGSGRLYQTLALALAGETTTELTGLVPQGGSGIGVLVGASTLSSVDDFYKDWIVVNTDTTPTNGLVAQYARVASYVGATRTMTLDKPFDFSAESDFALVDPARLTLLQDVAEDATWTKSVVLNTGGYRLKGKLDITGGNFHWVRGAGVITNGVQKTNFGVLRLDGVSVSRRDATIYALLMTNGSNLGRCEIKDCAFSGRVAGRRGYSGWLIQNCKNTGVNDVLFNLPYALVEAPTGVTITLSAFDLAIDSQFAGSCVYAEGTITGSTAYFSIIGSMRSGTDYTNIPSTSKRLSFFLVNGAATMSITTTSGSVVIGPGDVDTNVETVVTGITNNWAVLEAINYTGSCSVTLSSGGGFRAMFNTASNGAAIQIGGTVTMSGSVTLSGTDGIVVGQISGGSFICIRLAVAVTGSITLSGSGTVSQSGGGCACIVFAASMTSGTPTLTFSKNYQVVGGNTLLRVFIFSGGPTVSVGTWSISGGLVSVGYIFVTTPIGLAAGVSGGTWNVSSTFNISSLSVGDGVIVFADHLGTGGTLTVSGVVYVQGLGALFGTLAKATGAGATTVVSSASFIQRGGTLTTAILVHAVTATSSATLSGDIRFHNFTIPGTAVLATSTTTGSVVVGPSIVLFDDCSFRSTLATESGTGTFTWSSSTLQFRRCHFEGLVTIVGTRFSSLEFFFCRFSGSSSNNSVSFSGTRPTTYRYWKCSSLALVHSAGTPDLIDDYQVLPAAGAQTAANLVTVNSSGQSTNVVGGTNVIAGVLLNSPGGSGQAAIVVTKGKCMVAVSGTVNNGDHLVADTGGTPTSGVTNAASVSGKNVGFALEAKGATVANQSYSAVEVS